MRRGTVLGLPTGMLFMVPLVLVGMAAPQIPTTTVGGTAAVAAPQSSNDQAVDGTVAVAALQSSDGQGTGQKPVTAQEKKQPIYLTLDYFTLDDGLPTMAARQADGTPTQAAAQKDVPPPVEHTGLQTLVKDIISDFKAFPQRESTWVILGVGGAAALAVHPADNSVNSHLVSSGSADNLWKAGHIIGGPVMYGVPIALYLGGRYIWAPAKDKSQTNKMSHLGLDLLRAELEEEAIVQTLKFSVRRTRPNGMPYSFPLIMAALRKVSPTMALASGAYWSISLVMSITLFCDTLWGRSPRV